MAIVRRRVDHSINLSIQLNAHLLPTRAMQQDKTTLISCSIAQRVGTVAVPILSNEFDPIAHVDQPAVNDYVEHRLVKDGRSVRRRAAIDKEADEGRRSWRR